MFVKGRKNSGSQSGSGGSNTPIIGKSSPQGTHRGIKLNHFQAETSLRKIELPEFMRGQIGVAYATLICPKESGLGCAVFIRGLLSSIGFAVLVWRFLARLDHLFIKKMFRAKRFGNFIFFVEPFSEGDHATAMGAKGSERSLKPFPALFTGRAFDQQGHAKR